MDMDGDGGRREFGLSGQRRGTESDKEPPQIRFADITLRIEKDCGLSAAFILRDSSENSRELLFARSGEFNSCFSTCLVSRIKTFFG